MANTKPVHVDTDNGELRVPRDGDGVDSPLKTQNRTSSQLQSLSPTDGQLYYDTDEDRGVLGSVRQYLVGLRDTGKKINTISDIIGDTPSWYETLFSATPKRDVLGYYSVGDGGGGTFYWDSSESQTSHNGGTIVDPDHTATPGQTAWYSSVNSGSGCWVKLNNEIIDVREFGVKDSDSEYQYTPMQAIIDYFDGFGGGVIEIPNIDILIGDVNNSNSRLRLLNHEGLTIRGQSKQGTRLLNDYEDDTIQIFNVKSNNVLIKNITFEGLHPNAGDYFSKYGVLFEEGADGSIIRNCISKNGMIIRAGEIGSSPEPPTNNVTFKELQFFNTSVGPFTVSRAEEITADGIYMKNCGGNHPSGSGRAITLDSVRKSNFSNFILEDSVGFKLVKDEQDSYDVSFNNFYIKAPDEATDLDTLVQFAEVSSTTDDLDFTGININNMVIIYGDYVTPLDLDVVKGMNINNLYIKAGHGNGNGQLNLGERSRNIQINNLITEDTWVDIEPSVRDVKISNSIIQSSNFRNVRIEGDNVEIVNSDLKQTDNGNFNVEAVGNDIKFINSDIWGGESCIVFSQNDERYIVDNCNIWFAELRGVASNSTNTKIVNCSMIGCNLGWRQQEAGLLVKNTTVEFDGDTSPSTLTSDIVSGTTDPTLNVGSSDIDKYREHEFVTITDDDSSSWETYIISIDYQDNEIQVNGDAPSDFTTGQNTTIVSRKRATNINLQDSTNATLVDNNFDTSLNLNLDATDEVVRNKGYKNHSYGLLTDTTDGSGRISVAHGFSSPADFAIAIVKGDNSYDVQFENTTSSNVVFRIRNINDNSDVTGTEVTISWEARLIH